MICVLLSSYNGEKYIRKQIKSILCQSNVDVYLLIRDDGSTDNTVDIIKEMQKSFKNIGLIQGDNWGYIKSFYYLLAHNNIQADYYAFSDQDDIWMPNKLFNAIKHMDDQYPFLYGSNLIIRDVGLQNIDSMSSDKLPTDTYLYPNKGYITKLFLPKYYYLNNPYGCTMVWNKKLQDVVLKNDNRYNLTQDRYLNVLANNGGKIYIDPNSYIIHLIHGNNTAGIKPNSVVGKIQKYFRYYFKNKNTSQTVEICKYICEVFNNSDDNICSIAKCKESLIARIHAINKIINTSLIASEKRKYIILIILGKI